MSSKLKVAIVGFGWFGKQHYSVYKSMPDVEVVSICDTNNNAFSYSHNVQDEFHKNISSTNNNNAITAKLYTDIVDMLKHEQIDLLDITAIESEHYTLAMLGLDAGCHLLVEKPLTINYDHSLRLYETALRKNLYFYTGNVLRFDSRYRALSNILSNIDVTQNLRHMSLERNFQVKSHYTYGRVHPAYSACVHDIDLTLWLSHQNVTSVTAYGRNFLNRTYPDSLVALLELQNGALACIQNVWHISNKCPYGFEFSTKLMTNHNYYQIRNEPVIHCWHDSGVEYPEMFFWPTIDSHISGALKDEITHYVACAKQSIESPVLSMKDSIRSIQVASSMVESLTNKNKSIQIKGDI